MKKKLPDKSHIIKNISKKTYKVKEKMEYSLFHAEWLDSPDSWNEKGFIRETSDFLINVYGSLSTQDRHLIGMLAIEISQYLNCLQEIKSSGILAKFNNGKTTGANPYVSIKNNSLTKIVMLMNQLGLTLKDRLKNGVREQSEESNSITKLLDGPLAY